MAEYYVGHEFIREPDALLPEGSEVNTHTHNAPHNTHLTMGLWDVIRKQPITDEVGNRTGWLELPVVTIQGGGPRSIVPIPANMAHSFILRKGWGFYRCVFASRDGEGNLVEAPMGYTHWHV